MHKVAKPLVSICIPCYNASAYVAQAIDSILAQSWPEIEIIIVNDGSTDGSGAIIDSYASSSLRIIHQENRGQCAAANRAFAEAQGDLIKFFDADDLLNPRFVELQVNRLGGCTTAVASAEWGRFYLDSPSTFLLNPEGVWRDLAPADWLIQSWADAQPMMQCGLWLIPREILERSGGWDESLSLINDFEFFSRVLCFADEVRFTPGACLYYRSGISGSLSQQKTRKAYESAFSSLIKGTSYLLEKRSDSVARRSCANLFQNFVFDIFPWHRDLIASMEARIDALGGSDLCMPAGPRLAQLSRLLGWRNAKRLRALITGY
jgi:glycosyltransferase involved in cell wall biosynthesis